MTRAVIIETYKYKINKSETVENVQCLNLFLYSFKFWNTHGNLRMIMDIKNDIYYNKYKYFRLLDINYILLVTVVAKVLILLSGWCYICFASAASMKYCYSSC